MFNPYANLAFGQYKMTQKTFLKTTETLAHMHATHLRVLSESYPMNTNMAGFRWFSKTLCVLVLWREIVSALEGLKPTYNPLFKSRSTMSILYDGPRRTQL